MKLLFSFIIFLIIGGCNNNAQNKSNKIEGSVVSKKQTDSVTKRDSILFFNQEKSIFFGYSNYEETDIGFKHIADGFPNDFVLKNGSPNGVEFLVFYKKRDYAKELGLIINYDNFDEFDELKDGYFCQASFHDLDGDGTDELIIAIGNSINDNTFYVLKYIPNNHSGMSDFKDWKIISNFKSKNKVRIDNNVLYKINNNKSVIDSIVITPEKAQ